jgi:hypothetical protein
VTAPLPVGRQSCRFTRRGPTLVLSLDGIRETPSGKNGDLLTSPWHDSTCGENVPSIASGMQIFAASA